MSTLDVAVIGKGLIGSAALRHLSTTGSVAIIGPDEPQNPAAHDGVFSSHYDQGRITRLIGRDPIYSKLADRAIAQYATIENASGIRFHHPVGMVIAQAPHVADGHMKDPLGTARALGLRFTHYPLGDRSWKQQFEALDFPATHSLIHEPAPAGYINPRELIRAQLRIASQNGARILRETVGGLRRNEDAFDIITHEGGRYRARRVIVAAGAFANFNGLLPQPLDFQPETETVLLAEVSPDDAARLSGTPTVIYMVDDPEIWDIYMTPPIRYPNGRFFIKLGANTAYDRELETLAQVQAWFRSGNSDASREPMIRAVRALWPGVDFLTYETRRCILCRTTSGYPIVDAIEEGLFVAAGGNGGSAKSSDAIGDLAARLARNDSWPRDIPRDLFRVP